MYAKCYKCDKSVANGYYIPESDPQTTWTLLMTYNIVQKSNTGRHTVRIYLTTILINRRNGISTITHSYRKNPCAFHCKNPFRTLKAKINYLETFGVDKVLYLSKEGIFTIQNNLNTFWINVFEAWAKFELPPPTTSEEVLSQTIWSNKNIKRNGRSFIYQS